MEYIENYNDDGVLRITMSGRFTHIDNAKIIVICRSIVENKTKVVDVDMGDLTFIDSSGIGMLLVVAETIQSIGGVLTLHNMKGQVDRILKVSRFDQLLIRYFEPTPELGRNVICGQSV